MTTKQLNIKNNTYYFYNDLINLSNFSVNNLKLDRKAWKDIDIYCIGYVDKNKPKDWKVNSVYPLYLMINRVFCCVGEKNGVKYFSIDKGIRNPSDSVLIIWNQVVSGLKYCMEEISRENSKYDDDYDKTRFITNDNLPLGKLIYFPS